MNEHIGRKQAIGIGKESSAGTPVAATAWIPKKSGAFKPVFEKAKDDSAYGVIDEVYDSQTVKNMTEVEVEGIVRDNWLGLLLLGTLGQHTTVFCMTLTTPVGGTPKRGDLVSHTSPAWSGVIKKILRIGAVDYYFMSTTSGTLTDAKEITDGVWTATITLIPAVKGHLFTRLNTNAHPAFTLYGSDPVADERASYCLVDTFEIEFKVGDFAMFKSTLKGKKLGSASAQSPAYTSDNAFLAKHASVRFAADEAGLNLAAESEVQRFKMTTSKNLVDVQAFGDTDVASIHNQQYTIAGDLEAIYNATTLRDLVANSTKQACRLMAMNNEVTPLYVASPTSNNIYPTICIDMARLSFEEWTRSNDNNALVNQTMGFAGEFDNSSAMTYEVLLLNSNASAY